MANFKTQIPASVTNLILLLAKFKFVGQVGPLKAVKIDEFGKISIWFVPTHDLKRVTAYFEYGERKWQNGHRRLYSRIRLHWSSGRIYEITIRDYLDNGMEKPYDYGFYPDGE